MTIVKEIFINYLYILEFQTFVWGRIKRKGKKILLNIEMNRAIFSVFLV
jgi:hypothetical protein